MAKRRACDNVDCSRRNKMRSLPAAHDDSNEGAAVSHVPSDSLDAADGFGEPTIQPRIGDEYQAELPPLIGNYSFNSYLRNCTDRVFENDAPPSCVGLPLLLISINGQKHESLETVSDSNVIIEPPHCSVEPERESQILGAEEIIQKSGDEVLVPGLLREHWGDVEKERVLLALYIFEKNFDEVKRFIETRNMGAILSYYYCEFYGSKEYKRWWSVLRKLTKRKKSGNEQKLLSGVRQQELLSRILPRVSEESKSTLLEVSKKFVAETISLEEYVSVLKAMVGVDILVEIFGIGTGNDLTGMGLDPCKSNQVAPLRQEIPTGKDYSLLTTTAIIKILNGPRRMSKALTNNLFSEAVWPRLLGKGWHSEKPSSHGLVFLVPGIKKFTRRLVKGDQYYDSVTDVLTRISREPELIETSNGEAECGKNKEESSSASESQQRNFYLQPRTPDQSMDSMKFTVLDTGVPRGRARVLRDVPPEMAVAFMPPNGGGDMLEVGESDASDAFRMDILKRGESGGEMHPGRGNRNGKDLKKDTNDNKRHKKVSKSQPSRKQKEDDLEPLRKRSRKSTANSHEETIGRSSNSSMAMTPVLEKGMSSCCVDAGVHESHLDLSFQVSSSKGSPGASESNEHVPTDKNHSSDNGQMGPLFDLNLPHVCPDLNLPHAPLDLNFPLAPLDLNLPHAPPDLNLPHVPPDVNLSHATPDLNLPHAPPDLNLPHAPPDLNLPHATPDLNLPHVRPDLNLPHVPVDFDYSVQSIEQNDQTSYAESGSTQQQPNPSIPLRHSLRSRPPTVRVLEAVADGYLAASPRRRRMERNTDGSNVEASPRPSQLAHVSGGGDPSDLSNSSTGFLA